MSWFKLDDRFFDNPKIAALSDRAKVAYLEAGTYCARELTDGFVPANKAKTLAGTARALKELSPHLWEPVEGGYRVHDYLKYNPTREQVLAEREAAKKRMQGVRSVHVRPNNGANIDGSSDAPVSPIPDPVNPVIPEIPAPAPPNPLSRGRSVAFECYEQLFGIGRINEFIRQDLIEVDDGWEEDCIRHCFREAAESNARSWKFVKAIFDRHKREGCYGNGSREGSGKSGAEPNSAGVAGGVSLMERRQSFVAKQRQRSGG